MYSRIFTFVLTITLLYPYYNLTYHILLNYFFLSRNRPTNVQVTGTHKYLLSLSLFTCCKLQNKAIYVHRRNYKIHLYSLQKKKNSSVSLDFRPLSKTGTHQFSFPITIYTYSVRFWKGLLIQTLCFPSVEYIGFVLSFSCWVIKPKQLGKKNTESSNSYMLQSIDNSLSYLNIPFNRRRWDCKPTRHAVLQDFCLHF